MATVAGAVTDDSNAFIKMMRIDDTTKGLKVMAVGGTVGTVSSISNSDGTLSLSPNPIVATGTISLAALPSGDILVGNVSNVATAVAVSGDVSLANTGAITLATVNSNVGSFTNANITVNAKGLITAASNGSSAGLTIGTTTISSGTNTRIIYDNSGVVGEYLISGTGTTVAMATSPSLTGAILDTTSTAITQTAGDNSTKLATTAFVANAILGQDFKEAAKYATIAALPTVVYNNGSSGVGATITAVAVGAISIDSNTPSVGDRILVKNQVSTFQNGIYLVTTVGTVGTVFVLTRTTDFNQSSEIDTGDTLFVSSGTTLSATTWAYNGIDAPTMGTTAITFAQTAGQGSFTGGNGITITGTSIAINTSVVATNSSNLSFFSTTTSAQLAGIISDESGSGALLFGTTPTIVTPNINGISTGTGVASASTASTLLLRDANGNSTENNVIEGFTTTATAAGTTTLTITSTFQQYFTGTTTQTVKLPTTSVVAGGQYEIVNLSTGLVTVQSSGANNIVILGAGMTAIFTSLVATPTTAANWSFVIVTGSDVNNAITATTNAATINLAYTTNTVTNNSAAALTITLPTAGAIDGEKRVVRILDFSAVAQTLTFVNTENSNVSVPAASNGSTTLFLTVGFMYNGGTSKWRCLASE